MKNLKRVSVALMLALGTTFAMTSCGGGEDAAKALEEMGKDLENAVDEAAAEIETEVEVVEEEMPCEEGKCGDAMEGDSAATCEGGDVIEEVIEVVEEETGH